MTVADVPSRVRESEYAVRGEIVIRSQEIEKNLAKYPFDKLIPCNIGNPQAVGQQPLTFHRELLSLMSHPPLRDEAKLTSVYPEDVLERARLFNNNFGAYSHSKGGMVFRERICDYIEQRDKSGKCGRPNPENIYITDGASPAIKTILELLIRDCDDEILIPIPQYPLYSASVTRLGGKWVGYELKEDYDEEDPSWKLDIDQLAAKIKPGKTRGVVIINPGNPTGNVLTRGDLEALARLCEERNLPILADEVYQANVYSDTKEFVSMREVVADLKSSVELFSFHSISKGYYGECGLRGGYMELMNVHQDINEEIYKMMSMTLCSNTLAQGMLASIMTPPKEGEPSFPLFHRESSTILDSMKRKAGIVSAKLNEIPGVDCMPIEGAMYAFPRVQLPAKYIEYAKKEKNKLPDTLYCLEVLENLGVIMVPGNGFGQKEGTFHYRMTILPPEEDLVAMLDGLKKFQEDLLAKWA